MSRGLLTTTVGSLPKPDYVQRARSQHAGGKISREELDELERRATREVISLQEELGLDILVDGEMYRGDMVAYFAEFLDPRQQDIGTIKGNDLRRFIIALQEKPKFANHPYNKTQPDKLSAQSIETYCRGIRSFFAFLKREGFISTNVVAKVTMPKVPEIVIPTFSEKEIAKLLS